jgi:predicted nucleotide-binding protein
MKSDLHSGASKVSSHSVAPPEGLIPLSPEQVRARNLLPIYGSRPDGDEPNVTVTPSKRVFIVHGHADGPREAVARFLEQLGLEPVILHEHANQGRTIIEKFEAHADVGFAVVLLTPDDVGGSSRYEQRPRARQNVILELGYFIGRLGRGKVCALKADGVELPSDILGVAWTPLDPGGAWKRGLAKELEAAGYRFDWNFAMRA